MKVLHVIPSVSSRSGGPAQAIIPMCLALQENGIDVMLATTDSGLEIEASETPIRHKGVPTMFFPAQLGESFKFSRPMATWLNANVRKFDIVHIHAIFNHSCVSAASACRKQGVPYVIRPLGTLDPWSMSRKRFRKRVFWQLRGRTMVRGASAMHYTTRAEQEAVERSLGLNHGFVVPLGVESMSKAEDLPSIVADHPYVLVLSRLHPKKALDVLIDAFIAVVQDKRFEHWRLVLAGEGPADYVKLLRQKVMKRKAEHLVRFIGWLEGQEKQSVLQRASLLALPSYQENFGNCVMEAMAVGVPVIISPNVNLADKVQRASAGWISPINSTSLQTALLEALADDTERIRRGRAGKTLAQSFSWNKIAVQWKDLYSSLAN